MTIPEDEQNSSPSSFSSANDNCTIPPALPPAALADLMFKRDRRSAQDIQNYVEWQAKGEIVEHAERVTTEFVLGRRVDAWDVYTDQRRWWVITSPTNLYSQELFPSLDYAISFHVGVTARMMSKPDSGVSDAEQSLMRSAWRRWEQAAELLDEAEEAEDFQAVGMRCRECLVSMVKSISKSEMVPAGESAPKRADFVGWSVLIANYIAHGESSRKVRGYLKAISDSGWQLVSWLTHASSSTRADGILAVEATQHILATFNTALFRHTYSIPDQCGHCGSYKITTFISNDDQELMLECQACRAIWKLSMEQTDLI